MSSDSLIVEWLCSGNNYVIYHGDTDKGRTKLRICQEDIAPVIKQCIDIVRSPEQIQSRISKMEKKFRTTLKWAKNTGQGVKKNDGMQKFHEILNKKCPFFDDLEKVMGSRASM